MDARRLCLLFLLLATPPWAAGQTVSLTTGGRQVQIAVGDAATLPADFPTDIVLPEGHALTRVQHAGTTAATTLIVELDAPGDPGTVAERFRAGMLVNGWTATAIAPPASGQVQAWVKDSRAVLAWLVPSADGAHLQLQLLPRR